MDTRYRIRHLIKEKGLIQAYVARKAGMTPQKFSDILNGRSPLYVEQLKPISEALGVKETELVKAADYTGDHEVFEDIIRELGRTG